MLFSYKTSSVVLQRSTLKNLDRNLGYVYADSTESDNWQRDKRSYLLHLRWELALSFASSSSPHSRNCRGRSSPGTIPCAVGVPAAPSRNTWPAPRVLMSATSYIQNNQQLFLFHSHQYLAFSTCKINTYCNSIKKILSYMYFPVSLKDKLL